MEAAEAMCESVAIVDHGRLVAGGKVRDLKRASGRRTLRITLEGEWAPSWLSSLPGIAAVRQDSGGAELELLPVADPAAILSAVIAHGGAITRFQVVEPSLEAIFIEHVGRSADDDEERASEAMMPSITMEGIA
jgi:ABC-2 type transport system ATP-binding protein